MTSFANPILQPFAAFMASLAIVLLIGLERERTPASKAGLRTFAWVALAGTLGALLSEHAEAPWMLGAGLLVMGSMMVTAYLKVPQEGDHGTTSCRTRMPACSMCEFTAWQPLPKTAPSPRSWTN